MPRSARIAPGGVVFHVLNRGVGRRRVFEDAGDFDAFERILTETVESYRMRLCAYCLMPNHWHLVLWPWEDGDLGRFMQRLTITHVRRWQPHHAEDGWGHLYQGRYKSFPVQDDGHFLTVCRYVERNPLRARLVERAEHWKWSSLWRRERGDAAARAMLCDWAVEQPAGWLEWVNEPEPEAELAALRQSITRNRPFGEAPWQRRMVDLLGLASSFRPNGRPPKRLTAAV